MKILLNSLLAVTILLATGRLGFAQEELKGSLNISGAWAIYPTAVAWAQVFQEKNPGVKIDITAGGAGKGAADAISGLVDIGMVSRDPDKSELTKITAVKILKDAVFAVINEKNTSANDLLASGVKKEALKEIYVSGLITTWGQLANNKDKRPIHVYTRSDASGAASSWATFLGKKQEDLKGIGIFGDPGLLETVKRDPIGIGYNNFSYVFDKAGNIIAGVKLLPIDANSNGKADQDELIHNRVEAAAIIQAGKYPAKRENYFFIKDKNNALIKAFIEFALSDEGKAIVDRVGASLPLTDDEIKEALASF